jgi:flagellar hook-associated protein 3 FlgL
MQRVSNPMIQNLMLSDMHNNLSRLLEYQHQLATGKKHSRPSDNPIDVVRELSLQTAILENGQYIRNQDDAITWLSNTDTAFNQMMDISHRIRELTIYAGNGALGEGETEAIAAEISELQEELRNTANYSVEGRYLLSGLSTGVRPFERDASGNVAYMGNTGKVSYEGKGRHRRRVLPRTGSLPVEYTSNTLTSVEVPLDFAWTGRDEISPDRRGQPERQGPPLEDWTDENINGIDDLTDYNRFRDDGELRGLSLDRIAELINESLNMGDASRLLSVSVEKDMDAGTQRLVFTSHTGEPIQVTGWPDTDGCSRPRPSSASTPRRGLRRRHHQGLLPAGRGRHLHHRRNGHPGHHSGQAHYRPRRRRPGLRRRRRSSSRPQIPGNSSAWNSPGQPGNSSPPPPRTRSP